MCGRGCGPRARSRSCWSRGGCGYCRPRWWCGGGGRSGVRRPGVLTFRRDASSLLRSQERGGCLRDWSEKAVDAAWLSRAEVSCVHGLRQASPAREVMLPGHWRGHAAWPLAGSSCSSSLPQHVNSQTRCCAGTLQDEEALGNIHNCPVCPQLHLQPLRSIRRPQRPA